MVILFFAYALMALTFSLAWAVMQYAQPLFTIGFRMILAGIILLGYLLFTRQSLRIKKQDVKLFVQTIFFHIFLSYVTEFYALKVVSGATSALIFNLSPFVSALFSYFMLHERLSKRKWLGLIVGFAGFIPLFCEQTPVGTPFWQQFSLSWAELLLLASVVSATYGWIIVTKLVAHRHYSPIHVNGVAMLGAGILSMGCSLLFEAWTPIPVNNFWSFLWLILALLLIGNILYFNIIAWILRRFSPTYVTFVGFITPLLAACYDWLFFGKIVPTAFYITAFIVTIGLCLFYSDGLKDVSTQEPPLES